MEGERERATNLVDVVVSRGPDWGLALRGHSEHGLGLGGTGGSVGLNRSAGGTDSISSSRGTFTLGCIVYRKRALLHTRVGGHQLRFPRKDPGKLGTVDAIGPGYVFHEGTNGVKGPTFPSELFWRNGADVADHTVEGSCRSPEVT